MQPPCAHPAHHVRQRPHRHPHQRLRLAAGGAGRRRPLRARRGAGVPCGGRSAAGEGGALRPPPSPCLGTFDWVSGCVSQRMDVCLPGSGVWFDVSPPPQSNVAEPLPIAVSEQLAGGGGGRRSKGGVSRLAPFWGRFFCGTTARRGTFLELVLGMGLHASTSLPTKTCRSASISRTLWCLSGMTLFSPQHFWKRVGRFYAFDTFSILKKHFISPVFLFARWSISKQ